MTLYELLKYHEGESVILRRITWDKNLFIRCEDDALIEQCVNTNPGEFLCPWYPWKEDILADDWEEVCP